MSQFSIHQVTNMVNTLSGKNFEESKDSSVNVLGEVASDKEITEVVSAMQRGHLYTQASYMGNYDLVQAGPVTPCEAYDELVEVSRKE